MQQEKSTVYKNITIIWESETFNLKNAKLFIDNFVNQFSRYSKKVKEIDLRKFNLYKYGSEFLINKQPAVWIKEGLFVNNKRIDDSKF